ncbi:DUF6197 family protein [Actinoplanes aureus]|uniref:DUF6197 family protein n=1 Tax=Actinoplanes aureus TaxID=2792083 RepID=UPI001E5F3C70|nr:hypothetical protein [Actinoplanes aureus]
MNPTQQLIALAADRGYVLTEAGRVAVQYPDLDSMAEAVEAVRQGVSPDQIMTEDWDGLSWFEPAVSLGAAPHDSAYCREGGRPHLGPCVEPDASDALTEVGRRALNEACRCGDSDCADTFGRATACQDRSGCCQFCGYSSCDVCGWTDPADSADPPETVAQVLRSAALYLERHGWIQGCYYDGTTGVFTPPACLVGAIGMVCYGGPVDAPAEHRTDPGYPDFEQAVLHLDRYLLVEDGSESYEFNDARGRTLEQVTHVLRDAATRPAEELLDALRAINEMNDRLAESGVTVEQIVSLLNGGDFR